MSIEQELIYLDQLKALFAVCGAADRLLDRLRRAFPDPGLLWPEFDELHRCLAAAEGRGFLDREKVKAGG